MVEEAEGYAELKSLRAYSLVVSPSLRKSLYAYISRPPAARDSKSIVMKMLGREGVSWKASYPRDRTLTFRPFSDSITDFTVIDRASMASLNVASPCTWKQERHGDETYAI